MSINLKDKLKNGERTLGTWLSIDNEIVAEIIAKQDFDWVVIDVEHSSMSISKLQKLVRIIDLAGSIPLVRIGENNNNLIKRVMDTGAKGVVVPMIETIREASKACWAVKYPPDGIRGLGLSRAQWYGENLDEYLKFLKEKVVVVGQIESKRGIEHISYIASSELDALMIGPYDLSASMGIPGDFENNKFCDAMKRFVNVCNEFSMPMGYHIVNHKDELRLNNCIYNNYTFLAIGLDTIYLKESISSSICKTKNTIKSLMRDRKVDSSTIQW